MAKYRQITEDQVPTGVRFDVERRDQGQIIEVAYGDFGRGPVGEGDLYRRITDRAARTVTYHQRVGAYDRRDDGDA